MVEPIMYFAIGFLVSMLLALLVMPLVHNRAVRLTTKRLEAATPLSMAEIQADKDQLRAEFAMSARRLEMTVEQLKNKSTSQLAELGKKSDAINRLKTELSEKNAAIFSLEAREKALREQSRASEEQLATRTEALRQAEQALSDKDTELARLGSELAARDQEIGLLRQQIEDAQKLEQQLREEIATATCESAALDKLRGEKAAVEDQLRAVREERARLQRDLDAVRQASESAWSTEHVENALLRERINDIAAEVARLAVTLEGPNSPIESILAAEPQKPSISAIVNGSAGNGAAAEAAAGEARGTLAERIRALQAQASRARKTG